MSWADHTLSDYYCEFCGESFDSDKDFRNHCNSPEHRSVLVSDGGRTWKHRPPPRSVPRDELCVCQGHRAYGQCRLGDQCCEAHGEDELEEWKERLDYRHDRVTRAQEKHLEGYQEYASQLLRRYSEARDPAAMQRIMTESLPGLRLTCQQQLKCTVSSKDTQLLWDFELHTITPLQRLVLLRDTFRSHFQLRRVRVSVFNYVLPEGCQEWINTLKRSEEKKVLVYLVQVAFQASMYATFVQTLVFDFGGDPVLMRNFSVDTVPPDMLGDIERNRRVILVGHERWSPTTVDLVPFAERRSGRVQSLQSMYPPPDPEGFQLTQAVMGEELSRQNYRARMHELLYVEEMARADIIAQFNLCVPLELSDSVSTTSAHATEALYAPSGELFACLRLDAQVSITEDTDAGRLLLQGCTHVWLSPAVAEAALAHREEDGDAKKKRRVYELPIQLTKKDRIYIRLTKECVQEFGLKPQSSFEAEVQFLLDRLPLCEMHYAVEKLPMADLVFPDFGIRPPQCPPEWGLSWDPRLNEQQRRAVSAIVAPRTVAHVPPVLVVGPFGTGKTFTLATALVEVVRQEPGSRVLVCTQSNSAADLYVLDHLDRKVGDRPELRPLRVLYEYRLPNRMDQRLLQYCLEAPREQQSSKQGPWFRQPTVEDLEAHRVVVTTLSSSKMLLDTGVKRGFFTHIFIDEAAQAMETQCILPLALADKTTRIVLAGDYMQLNPEVFSVFTRERRLHVSLLERLHDAFPRTAASARGGSDERWPHPCQVVLGDNYRSHEALVRFASESFYQGRLRALGCPGPHHVLHPLSFFAVRGSDLPRDGSTSYLNTKEVAQVCEVVKHLVDHWSMTWGPCDPSTIAVVTPYYDQVQCIRAELRNRKLGRVRVETVANVQGREFRAVVLSTVRTRATCVPLERAVRFKAALLNFGFLSDAKLLNTALTRAQSLVAVVGDPVSLCSVGACRTLWEKFVTTCARNGSLHNMHWDDIKYHLDGFELQKEYGLNPHAESFWPKHPFLNQQPANATPPPACGYGPPGYSTPAAAAPMPFFSRHIPPPMPGFYVSAVDRRLYGMGMPEMPGLFPPGFQPDFGSLLYSGGPSQQQAGFLHPQYMQQQQQLYYAQVQMAQMMQQQQQLQAQVQRSQQQQYSQQPPQQPYRHPKPSVQPKAQVLSQPRPAHSARPHSSKPLGFNPDPTPSVGDLSGAPASMSARFGNMMLKDNADSTRNRNGGWTATSAGGRAPPSQPSNPPRNQAATTSQPKEHTRPNGLVHGGSFVRKMAAQAQQVLAPRQQAGSAGGRAQARPPAPSSDHTEKTFWNSAKHGPTSQPKAGATPTVAYVTSVSQGVVWGSGEPVKAQRQARAIPSISSAAGGLELYNALTRDDTSGDAKLASALRQGFAHPPGIAKPSAAGQPTRKPSYSQAVKNGQK